MKFWLADGLLGITLRASQKLFCFRGFKQDARHFSEDVSTCKYGNLLGRGVKGTIMKAFKAFFLSVTLYDMYKVHLQKLIQPQ